MATRVGIVEDDARLRESFARLVRGTEGFTCVGGFQSAEDALAALPALQPDVVLMDINLPGMSGIECARRLKQAAPAVNVVMLTTFDDSDKVFDSLKAGASGYLLKRASGAEIVAAVTDVCAGGAPMSGTIARKVVDFFGQRPALEGAALTGRERQVLDALSEGQQYKEIADMLGISINTVRNHIKKIYEKLHVNTRQDAVNKLRRV
ncbi:MAG: DNA-binding response regulator [Verrucomicrobia bacterium RIFCSPLOWO2_12_FULL_64_8]|nr:MAG: DNA-binding response regulator [Verrucomicrobia bacterium RIFCSPLOWO2_12_FULL_64_8]